MKVGDLFEACNDSGIDGSIIELTRKEKDRLRGILRIGVGDFSPEKIGQDGFTLKEYTRPLPYANSLNKKLYPDRVEYNGQLLPPEIAEKIKLAKENEVE